LYRCEVCALGFRHPVQAESVYESLYENAKSGVWAEMLERREDQLRVQERIHQVARTGSVLDVGCYDGALLAALGTDFTRFGIEASMAAASEARAKGVQILGSRIQDLVLLRQQFDIVCAIDVIEHVTDPLSFLSNMARVLSPQGKIILSTGSLDTPAWLSCGGNFWYCAIPEHISFVSESWAHKAAAKLGLCLESIQTFAYRNMESGLRALGQARFKREVVKSRLKRQWVSMLPGKVGRSPPRTPLGYAGLFEDHMIITFGWPAKTEGRLTGLGL
jgi:SAM-dependent methyltransferase